MGRVRERSSRVWGKKGGGNERALPIFSSCVHLNGVDEGEQAKATAIAAIETEQRPDHMIPDRRIRDGLGVLIGTGGVYDDFCLLRLHGQTNPPGMSSRPSSRRRPKRYRSRLPLIGREAHPCGSRPTLLPPKWWSGVLQGLSLRGAGC